MDLCLGMSLTQFINARKLFSKGINDSIDGLVQKLRLQEEIYFTKCQPMSTVGRKVHGSFYVNVDILISGQEEKQ